MRGLKSTIALVVVLAGLGAYIYFVTWKMPEGGAATTDAKKEKVFAALRGRQDRRGQGGDGGRRCDDAEERGRRVEDHAAVRAAGVRIGSVRADLGARPGGNHPRHRREPVEPQRLRPVEPARRDRLQGRRRQGLPQAATSATRRRPAATCSRSATTKRKCSSFRRPTKRRSTGRRSTCATRRC